MPLLNAMIPEKPSHAQPRCSRSSSSCVETSIALALYPGGVVIIGTLVTAMNYNHPYSERVRKYVATTPIVPTVSGRVTDVTVRANTPVQKGDVLFRIDDVQYRAKVESITAELTSAREDLARATQLAKSGAGPRRNQDLAQAKVDDLTAQLLAAQDNLDETVVRAPTNGYVTQLFLHPGMMAVSLPLRPVMVFVPHEEDIFAEELQGRPHRARSPASEQ